MKIHEKILMTYFDSCNAPVDKEGYLHKKGEINTSYQKRWCVLKGNILFYKERPSDRDVIGVIVLEGCTVQLCESEEQFAFSLVWSEPLLRTYKFAAEDQAGQESWIKALLSASHRYLRVLVTDMEKKYRETLSALSTEQANAFNLQNFNAAQAGYAGSYHSKQMSALHPHSALSVGPGTGLSSSPTLHPTSKTASKRSPKLWPKRNANTVPVNTAPAFTTKWPSICLDRDEFIKLHEDFGKEVRELIVDWSKQGQDCAVEENLIDFG